MKIERLLSIVMLLINRRMVRAKELAELFEVSIRTIYRDIDAINQAGIPILTSQGANGGISLMEGYRLDHKLLTNHDFASIVTALPSISTSYGHKSNQLLLEKINSFIPDAHSEQFNRMTKQFIVDFSSWGEQTHLEGKIAQLKLAIEELRPVSFTYCSANGNVTQRIVEPYTLILKKQSWYLYAFCRTREQFRLFKLFRMKDVNMQAENFIRQDISLDDKPWQQDWNAPENLQTVCLRFNNKAKHLAEEWFGVENVVEDENGKYVVSVSFPEDHWLYGFILSFGPEVEVLEPEHIRQIIKEMAQRVADLY